MTSIRPTGAVPKGGPKNLKNEKKKKLSNYKELNSAKADKRQKTLWDWFSLFIRLRDCPDNSNGFAPCFTCGRIHQYKEMDAGHYISRAKKPTKYDERNVHIQCVYCNRNLHGNVGEYERRLGKELSEELRGLSRQKAKKMPLWEVESMIAKYRQKAKDEAYRVGVSIK